jgi:hypothetical protein
VSTFRLRYQSTDLEMPVGEFVIGRSSACSLAIDDALVSRRHAIFHVAEDGVTVEDLGSRNGISVNGRRVEGVRKVGHMDRVTIGSQELVVVEIGRRSAGNRPTQEYALCPACKVPIDPQMSSCPSCGVTITAGPMLPGATVEMQSPFAATAPGGMASGSFHLIAGIAQKGLAMGRNDEVERMLASHLDAMLEQARKNQKVPGDHVSQATGFALRLAESLSRTRWIDWTFRIHEATGRLMDAEVIDRLYDVVRKARYDDARPLRAYLAVVRRSATSMSAADRFLLKRLEGLERVISA